VHLEDEEDACLVGDQESEAAQGSWCLNKDLLACQVAAGNASLGRVVVYEGMIEMEMQHRRFEAGDVGQLKS
jgi:hypothetical protein